LSQLRDGPIGRFIPNEDEAQQGGAQPTETPAEQEADDKPTAKARFEEVKKSMDDFQASLDERIKMLVPGQSALRDMQADIAKLTSRVDELEKKLARRDN